MPIMFNERDLAKVALFVFVLGGLLGFSIRDSLLTNKQLDSNYNLTERCQAVYGDRAWNKDNNCVVEGFIMYLPKDK